LQLAENPAAGGRVYRDESAGGIRLPEVVTDRQRHFAATTAHRPAIVKTDLHQAEGFRVLPGLADTHRVAVAVADDGGVGAGTSGDADRREIAEQGMRVAADDHVDAAELGGHCLVGFVTLMGDQDDVLDSLCTQPVDRLLSGGDFVVKARTRQRSRRIHRLSSYLDADDADGDPAELFAQVGLQIVVGGARRKRRADRRFDVGGENGGLAGAAAQLVEKTSQAGIALVELVVAKFEDIEAHRVHQRRVGFAVVQRVVKGAGHRVARVNLEQIRSRRLEQRRQARKAAGTSTRVGTPAMLISKSACASRWEW
jgi:hypothetical protein